MADFTELRNIAVIAHVDHGKTTLVDALLHQTGAFHAKEQVRERVMDSYDLERERGITILAKNCSVLHNGVKINIIDTPGHADFGGEVERALHMADGALLVVDAFEGPMPQTRFVLRKSLAMGLRAVVIINKVDRPGCEPNRTLDRVFDLFVELNADDKQLDFPVLYASALLGWARREPDHDDGDMACLLDAIVEHTPPATGDVNAPFKMLVSNIDYNDYLGRIAIGRVDAGTARTGMAAVRLAGGERRTGSIERLYRFRYLEREAVGEAGAGEIVALAGIPDVRVGETIAAPEVSEAFAVPPIDPPTISMNFGVNTSPFAGRDGKYLTSRHLKARLERESWSNVALKVAPTESADVMHVSGRGLMHLSILIEQMRREGYEIEVSRPQVIFRKDEKGGLTEPVENVTIEVPTEYVGATVEILGGRGGVLKSMQEEGRFTRQDFVAPSRSLIGIRSRLMSATRGEAIFYHTICGYEPVRSEARVRAGGVLVSSHQGAVTGYALMALQDRGRFFIEPGDEVYEGMIVGESAKPGQIACNVAKTKHLTNVRSSTKELTERLNAPLSFGLEESLEFIDDDEMVEVTPSAIRMRKRMLREKDRLRCERRARKQVGP